MVASEDGHDRPGRDRRGAGGRDGRQPLAERLEATEGAGRLRQAMLAVACSQRRLRVGGNETPEGVTEGGQWVGSTGTRATSVANGAPAEVAVCSSAVVSPVPAPWVPSPKRNLLRMEYRPIQISP